MAYPSSSGRVSHQHHREKQHGKIVSNFLDTRLFSRMLTPRDRCVLSLQEFARAIGKPYSTVARWLERWLYLRVAGIEKVPSRGRGGAWSIHEDVVERWLNCDLPSPYSSPQT